jgi:hypothetical protein
MKNFMCTVAFFFSFSALGTTLDRATVTSLMLDRGNGHKVYIRLNSHQVQPVQCHANTSWEFVLDLSDAMGRDMYSSLLTLYATKSPGKFVGTSMCDLHENIETLQRLELK